MKKVNDLEYQDSGVESGVIVQGQFTAHFSAPISGEYGMASSVDERELDAIANFEPQTQ